MKQQVWFELDNKGLGGGSEDYWGFKEAPTQEELLKILSSINSPTRAIAKPELEYAPITDEEFESLQEELKRDKGLMGNSATEEDRNEYLRKFYGL